MIPFISSSRTRQKKIYCDGSQKSAGRVLTKKGPKGTTWDARNALYLDLVGI